MLIPYDVESPCLKGIGNLATAAISFVVVVVAFLGVVHLVLHGWAGLIFWALVASLLAAFLRLTAGSNGVTAATVAA